MKTLFVGQTVTLPAGHRVGMGHLKKAVRVRVEDTHVASDGSLFYGVVWTDEKSGRERRTYVNPTHEEVLP